MLQISPEFLLTPVADCQASPVFSLRTASSEMLKVKGVKLAYDYLPTFCIQKQ